MMTAEVISRPRALETPDARVRPTRRARAAGAAITALIVAGPLVALVVAVPLLWGHVIHLRDVVLATAFYLVTGFGVTVGYHRLFCHRSFAAKRPLKIALAAAGSMAVEGSVVGWVANHRRHHVFSDGSEDPHSPHAGPTGPRGRLGGLFHAHVGWLFGADTTSASRYANDLLHDRDLMVVNRLFPFLALASFAAPFSLGWLLSGTLAGALSALLWAGIIRMALLHHVTWSVNSLCHTYGSRPFDTPDRSTNFAPLAWLSFGESWHNCHHAYPSAARHGRLPHQADPAAVLIALFERAGWATSVRGPAALRAGAAR